MTVRTVCWPLFGLFGLFGSVDAWAADEVSPLSLLYAPRQGQGLATTVAASERTVADLTSLPLNNHGVSRFGLLAQSLDYGLTDQITASVTEVYAHAFAQNPLNPAEGRVGFRSPKFQLAAWAPLPLQWAFKSSTGLQFNPATSSRLNYGFVAGDLVWHSQAQPSMALALGLQYTAHKDIGSHSHTWRAEWQAPVGQALLRLRYAQTHLAGFVNAQGPFDPSRYTNWELELGRPLAPGWWGSLGYATERNHFRWLQVPYRMEMNSERHLQRVSLSVKWLWP